MQEDERRNARRFTRFLRLAPNPAPDAAEPEAGKESESVSPAEQHEKNQPPFEADGRNQVVRGGVGNVDKIRDILFSTHMRDYEARFARLEETANKETLELRETNRRRFDQLEGYIRKEFEALQGRLKSERDDHSGVAARQSRELKDVRESLGRRVRDMDDRASGTERSLREDMLQHARSVTAEAQERQDGITASLDRRFHELREGKTDRAALAALFMEVALRLSGQFQTPAAEERPARQVTAEDLQALLEEDRVAGHGYPETQEKIVAKERPPEPEAAPAQSTHIHEPVQLHEPVQQAPVQEDKRIQEEKTPEPTTVQALDSPVAEKPAERAAVQADDALVQEEKPAEQPTVEAHDTLVQEQRPAEPSPVEKQDTPVQEVKPAEQAKAEPEEIPEEPLDEAGSYRRAANRGDARAQLNLGYLYQTGKGVPQDDVQAAAWFRKAAEQGNPEAEYVLGGLYYEGHGVARDLSQATLWYRKAADQGNASAQVTLGVAYLTGEGVPQSYVESFFWIKLASGGTVPDVKPEDLAPTLDAIAIHLTPEELTQAQKRVREWLKASGSNA